MGEAAPMFDTDQPSLAAAETPELPPLFPRRIEFHLARKPCNGFGSYGRDRDGFQMETLNPEKSSGLDKNSGSGLELRVVKSETGERNGIDSELFSLRVTFKRIGAGLQNLGNTCFLNSVLQCLTYTEPLAAYLQSGKHQTSCRAAGFCALCAIQKHVSRALNSSGRIVAPKDLVSNLRCISRNFRNARQEDAHEYMVNLLESMHKCCLPSGVPSESPSAYDRSLVHKIFGGRLRSQVKCMQCSYCSNKFDPFLDLSLEIQKADSLHKALTHFTAKEQLDGGERQYQCQQCKQKVKALKQLTVYKPPHVLAIHLKRFGSHLQGQKINKKVDFAPTIDLKPFVTGPYDGDLKYTLYGVLVHAGWSTHSGHYYCFVRTSSGIWYSLDDNQVVQVGERKVLEQKAYMLFYVRDQTKFNTKKPASASHKETETNFNVLKGSMQNGSIERRSNGLSSHTSTQGDRVNARASNEGLVKIPAFANMSNADQATSLDVNVKNSASLKDSSLANLNSNESNGALVKIPADTIRLKADHPTTLDVKNNTVTLENGNQKIINASGTELSQLNAPHTSAKDSKCAPYPTIDSCNGHSGVEKADIDAVGRPLKSNTLGTGEEVSILIKNRKVEISKLIGDASRSAANVGQQPVLFPTTLEVLPKKKSADKTSHLAVKKKLFKTPIMKMNLGTNIIFRTTFGLRKRKKLRGRSCNSVKQKSGREHVEVRNFNESDLGPSTSENYEMPSHGLSPRSHNKKKKGNKSSGEDVTIAAESGIVIDELKERVCQNDHLVSMKKQQPVDYKSEVTNAASSANKRREVNRSGLSTVLKETTVPKWDDDDRPPTAVKWSKKRESVSIGYIGDEWDEDYDKGKQKKVRMNKIDFEGPNLFQEIAIRKAKGRTNMEPRPSAKRRSQIHSKEMLSERKR